MTDPVITTPRLVLGPLKPDDAPRLFAYRSIPEVYRYQGWMAADIEDAQRFIQDYSLAEPLDDGNWKQLGVRLRDGKDLIGDCGFRIFDDRQAEIGYTIAPESQGRGYGTEVVVALTDYLIRDQNLHRIIATTDPRNLASIRILEKLGFRREGHFKESVFIRGVWMDDLVFAVLRHEWSVRNPRTNMERAS